MLFRSTYHVTVSVADSTSGTPLQGSVTFDVVVGLALTNTTINNSVVNSHAGNITTVSATGNTGTVTYALSGTPPNWVTIDANTGVLSVSSSSVAGPQSVTVVATDGTTPSNATTAGTASTSISFTIQ